MDEIRDHWDSLAKKHGLDLKSTTKTPTIKRLEISALARAISKTKDALQTRNILEVGCGNGHNIFALSQLFPGYSFHGLDYSEEMIKLANRIKVESPSRNVKFDVADVLELANNNAVENEYNLVFTDRLLINLNSWKIQQQGLRQLLSRVKKKGYLLIIENFMDAYGNQNYLRDLVGLQARTPDPYNKFIDEFTKIISNHFICENTIFNINTGNEIFFNIDDIVNENQDIDIEEIKRYIYSIEKNMIDSVLDKIFLHYFEIPKDYIFPIEPDIDKHFLNLKKDITDVKLRAILTYSCIGTVVITLFIFLKDIMLAISNNEKQ